MRTHTDYCGDGHSVRVQYCDADGCNTYLGVNYPTSFCDVHSADRQARS